MHHSQNCFRDDEKNEIQIQWKLPALDISISRHKEVR